MSNISNGMYGVFAKKIKNTAVDTPITVHTILYHKSIKSQCFFLVLINFLRHFLSFPVVPQRYDFTRLKRICPYAKDKQANSVRALDAACFNEKICFVRNSVKRENDILKRDYLNKNCFDGYMEFLNNKIGQK